MAFRERTPETAEQAITLSAQQEEQIRQMAVMAGADPDFLIRFMTSIHLTEGSGAGPGFLSELPHSTSEEAMAANLGMSLLRAAFREGRDGDFSTDRMVEGFVDHEIQRGRRFESDTFIGEQTEAGLRREAREMNVDANTLLDAVRVYALFRERNPELADRALEYASGGNSRIAAMARAYEGSIQRTEAEDGRTEYWIRREDKRGILAQYNRTRLLNARISRMDEYERNLADRVQRWGGDYRTVEQFLRRMERGTSIRLRAGDPDERNLEIARELRGVLRRHGLRTRDLSNLGELDFRERGGFMSDFYMAYRPPPEIAVAEPREEREREVAFETTIEVGGRTYAVRYTPTEEEQRRFGTGVVPAPTVRRDLMTALTQGRVSEIREIEGAQPFSSGTVVDTAEFNRLLRSRWREAIAISRIRIRGEVA